MSSELPAEDVGDVALRLANSLEAEGCEYALGGALALGYWAEPRGTLDVDFTLFPDPHSIARCLLVLSRIGCDFDSQATARSLEEHGFCRVSFKGWTVDVFVSEIPFYAMARQRRREVPLAGGMVKVWDAETLCVFKMMFYRRKDLADVEQLIRAQGKGLDVAWVDAQIVEIFGQRDPRVSTWREIVAEVRGG
ncbi:nucleotidyl transferase AbiEii/AbiGii toxin family protein [Aeoliella sp. SH292]|uniref:nucleotidyl transferase AbiEii/AbiGii toxin family protein n=1 Tax=Aeoliella sp. SH292 TaxID=3454464 RepID=UPI003F9A0300